MPKKFTPRGKKVISWQKKKSDAFVDFADKQKDIRNNKKQDIAERIKLAGIKLKNTYKAKLGDDLRFRKYTVIKIDRLEGDIWLKSESNTVRKTRVFDKIFAPIIRGRSRLSKYRNQ